MPLARGVTVTKIESNKSKNKNSNKKNNNKNNKKKTLAQLKKNPIG